MLVKKLDVSGLPFGADAVVLATANSKLATHSNFEPPNLLQYVKANGSTSTFFKEGAKTWSITADNTYYKNGVQSMRVELRRDDTGVDSRRAEITLDEDASIIWHDQYIRLDNWQNDASPEVILQAHDRSANCSASPPFEIVTKYKNGEESYYIDTRYSNADYCVTSNRIERAPVYAGPVVSGEWVRWTIKLLPKTDGTGYLEVYKNGVLIHSLYNVNTNYVGANPALFWKTGVYKWDWAKTGYGGSTTSVRVLNVDGYATYGAATTYADIFGSPSNVPPTVNIGTTPVNLAYGTTTFSRTATDADLDNAIVTRGWALISGPNTPTIVSGATSTALQLSGLVTGTYVYRYTAVDASGATTSSDLTITVAAAPPPVPNLLPDVSLAGTPDSAVYNAPFTLVSDGGTDADGTIVALEWGQLEGPDLLLSATNTATVTATPTGAGNVLVYCKVTDNQGASTTRFVTIKIYNPSKFKIPKFGRVIFIN